MSHWRKELTHRLAACLLALGILAAVIHAPAARAGTWRYFGPAFDNSQCVAQFGSGVCVDGYLTGSVSFDGIPDNYSGNLHKTDVTAWTMSGSGVATLSTGANLTAGTFSFSSGSLGGWSFQARNGLTEPQI